MTKRIAALVVLAAAWLAGAFFAVEQSGRIRIVRNRVVAEDLLDLRAAALQILLQLSPPDPNLVGSSERIHPLIQGPHGCLDGSLGALHGAVV